MTSSNLEQLPERGRPADPEDTVPGASPHVRERADEPGGHTLLPNAPAADTGSRAWLWALLAGALALALIGGGLWWNAHRDPTAEPKPAPVAARTGLFVAVATPDSHLEDALYLADGDSSTALFVPGELILDAPSLGEVPLRDVLPVGADVPAVAFSDATGLKVDGSWVVPMEGLAALIDKVGGVSVDVDVPVQVNTIDIKAGGGQKLDGTHAMTYATWTAAGEAPSAQLARLGQVTSTLLASLPGDTAAVTQLLDGVPGSTTLGTDELAARLVAQRDALRGEEPASSLLPVTDSPTPDVPTGVAVDVDALQSFSQTHLPTLVQRRPGASGTVALQNASGVEALELDARRRLVDAGFRFAWRGLAEPVQDQTIVMVRTSSAKDSQLGQRVAKDLGLPTAQVVPAPNIVGAGQDAFVLLGTDFAPGGAGQPAAETPAQPEVQSPAEPAQPAAETPAETPAPPAAETPAPQPTP